MKQTPVYMADIVDFPICDVIYGIGLGTYILQVKLRRCRLISPATLRRKAKADLRRILAYAT
jgi:hypothetical protein